MRTFRVLTGVLASCVLVLASAPAAYSTSRVGVDVNGKGVSPGFNLLVPQSTPETYLVDVNGKVVHTWATTAQAALSAYVLADGTLLRPALATVPTNFTAAPGGQGGLVQELDWNSKVTWSFEYATNEHLQHHDVVPMPNGHVLMLAWDYKTVAEAVAMGRDPALLAQGSLWPDSVVEVNPKTNQIVWEWHVWDHLVQDRDSGKPNYGDVAKTPGRIDLNWATNGGQASWNHLNGIDYNPKLDQIMVSSREFSEVWVIDHDTTTQQAQGKKGDLLFRWGNPAASKNGTAADRQLFFQHNANWIDPGLKDAGSLLVFNNGDSATRPFTTVDEIKPTIKNGKYVLKNGVFQATIKRVAPQTDATDQFFAPFIGGAQRLANGDTLITDGPKGVAFEVTKSGETVWRYSNEYKSAAPTITAPSGFVIRPERLFRLQRYPTTFPGFKGKQLAAAKSADSY